MNLFHQLGQQGISIAGLIQDAGNRTIPRDPMISGIRSRTSLL